MLCHFLHHLNPLNNDKNIFDLVVLFIPESKRPFRLCPYLSKTTPKELMVIKACTNDKYSLGLKKISMFRVTRPYLRKVADPNIFFVGNIIISPAMNFPSMGFVFKNKPSCLFYFNSVSL